MSIGYACVHVGSEKTKLSTLRLKSVTPNRLNETILKNLSALEEMIKYNRENYINLYRISSDIIPFATHRANTVNWQKEYTEQFNILNKLIKDSNIRTSMHPGQYSIINSNNKNVVNKTIEDLIYHAQFLDLLGCDESNKIIIHVGGVYNDKKASMNRFIENYKKLPSIVKKRLILENDDRSYNINDVLSISNEIGIPVVFDYYHHKCLMSENPLKFKDIILECEKTWSKKDGPQKIHYSESNINSTNCSHSKTIRAKSFFEFYTGLKNKKIDIMLEVKDKNLSCIKCNVITNKNIENILFKKEKERYKYLILSKNLDCSNINNPLDFYSLTEEALFKKENIEYQILAAKKIWDETIKNASEKNTKTFNRIIDKYKKNQVTLKRVKNFLFKISKAQNNPLLLENLYFYIT